MSYSLPVKHENLLLLSKRLPGDSELLQYPISKMLYMCPRKNNLNILHFVLNQICYYL